MVWLWQLLEHLPVPLPTSASRPAAASSFSAALTAAVATAAFTTDATYTTTYTAGATRLSRCGGTLSPSGQRPLRHAHHDTERVRERRRCPRDL